MFILCQTFFPFFSPAFFFWIQTLNFTLLMDFARFSQTIAFSGNWYVTCTCWYFKVRNSIQRDAIFYSKIRYNSILFQIRVVFHTDHWKIVSNKPRGDSEYSLLYLFPVSQTLLRSSYSEQLPGLVRNQDSRRSFHAFTDQVTANRTKEKRSFFLEPNESSKCITLQKVNSSTMGRGVRISWKFSHCVGEHFPRLVRLSEASRPSARVRSLVAGILGGSFA